MKLTRTYSDTTRMATSSANSIEPYTASGLCSSTVPMSVGKIAFPAPDDPGLDTAT